MLYQLSYDPLQTSTYRISGLRSLRSRYPQAVKADDVGVYVLAAAPSNTLGTGPVPGASCGARRENVRRTVRICTLRLGSGLSSHAERAARRRITARTRPARATRLGRGPRRRRGERWPCLASRRLSAPQRSARAPGLQPCPHDRSDSTCTVHHRAARLAARRIHLRVGDTRRRRQGQGAQGRGTASDRLRRRRAGLPHARLHRRGGRRGLPQSEVPPLHPGRRACPS